jgi:integrase
MAEAKRTQHSPTIGKPLNRGWPSGSIVRTGSIIPEMGSLRAFFGYAVANGRIGQSPAAQLTAAVVGPPSTARTRVRSDHEIRFVMTAGIPQGSVLRFLLLTGLRLGEAYNASAR